jgi:two-component system, OmpR family, response regulator
MAMQLSACVVEDNPHIRENLVDALEELTCVHVVATAATEQAGLAWLTEHGNEWDLAIVDLFLGTGNGLRIVQNLTRHPGQKLVVFSNYLNPGLRMRCAQLGVDAVFDKSMEIDALVEYCARLCSARTA